MPASYLEVNLRSCKKSQATLLHPTLECSITTTYNNVAANKTIASLILSWKIV